MPMGRHKGCRDTGTNALGRLIRTIVGASLVGALRTPYLYGLVPCGCPADPLFVWSCPLWVPCGPLICIVLSLVGALRTPYLYGLVPCGCPADPLFVWSCPLWMPYRGAGCQKR